MRKVAKIVLIILLCSIMFQFFFLLFTRDVEIINDTKYTTIEELHAAYKEEINKESKYDSYPQDIVMYFNKENTVFVVCTYSSTSDSEIVTDALMIYIAKQDGKRFYIERPKGWVNINQAWMPLSTDYEDLAGDLYYAEYRTRTQNNCYAFVYKNKGESIDLYFDGIKMDEIACINPFSQEEFTLCYAVSNKTHGVIECIFVPMEERHTLETKKQEN